MKFILIVVLTAVLTVIGFGDISAQELNDKQTARVQKDIQKMKDVMGLSDSQVLKLTKYRAAYIQKKTEYESRYEKGSELYKDAMNDIVKSWRVMLRKTVTIEQIEKWKNREK